MVGRTGNASPMSPAVATPLSGIQTVRHSGTQALGDTSTAHARRYLAHYGKT